MGVIAPVRLTANPSFYEPDLIVTVAQPSGFMETLGGSALRVKISDVDKFVYLNRADIRTAVNAQQASANLLQSATITLEYVSTATYLVQTRQDYDDNDLADAGVYNVALPVAYRLAAQQGTFQFIRTAALFGVNAANSEGLLNTPNATSVNLPPDSFGNTTTTTYDNGQLATWFLGQIQTLLQTMYFLGAGPIRVVILGPQRILGYMALQAIVQVVYYQRPGAGSSTTAQVIKTVAEGFDIEIVYAYDDTLIGQGAAGSDVVLMVVPEAIVPEVPGINTNEFATLEPGMRAMTMQYANVNMPVEVTTPIPGGVDVRTQMRVSSGWAPRGQAVRILNMPF